MRHEDIGDGGEIARLAGELAEERMEGVRLRAEIARLTAELAEARRLQETQLCALVQLEYWSDLFDRDPSESTARQLGQARIAAASVVSAEQRDAIGYAEALAAARAEGARVERERFTAQFTEALFDVGRKATEEEREACEQIAEDSANEDDNRIDRYVIAGGIAARIRARGEGRQG